MRLQKKFSSPESVAHTFMKVASKDTLGVYEVTYEDMATGETHTFSFESYEELFAFMSGVDFAQTIMMVSKD